MVKHTPIGAGLGSAQEAVRTHRLHYYDTVVILIPRTGSKLLHSENIIAAADRLSCSCIVTQQQILEESIGHDPFV
jgi:hypothetical protein